MTDKLSIVHGGNISEARGMFPEATEPWIDLSTGINPHPYPVGQIAPDAWSRLPDDQAERKAQEAAARYYGVARADQVLPVPGTQAAIQLLPSLRTKCRVAVVGPTYNEHDKCWRRAGHDIISIATPADCPTGADVLVVVNPNNPDGRVYGPDALMGIKRERLAAGGWLIVDEAFADCVPGASLASQIDEPGVVLLRSFGKFFGLAGARLGFILAEKTLCDLMRGQFGPWATSGPALDVGARAMNDVPWIRNTLDRLECDAQSLDEILFDAGLEIVGGTYLYRLINDDVAPELFAYLGKYGLYVRRFPEQPTWLRFGLPADDVATCRLKSALGAWSTEPEEQREAVK